MKIQIKKLYKESIIPTKGSDYAAGCDLYAHIQGETGDAADKAIMIRPGENVKIDTGLSIKCPSGYFGAIFARSGLAAKQGLRPANCTGVIDEDYTGPIIVALYNDSKTTQTIKTGDRIAQIIFLPYSETEFEEVDDLEETERGAGGFGSSGK